MNREKITLELIEAAKEPFLKDMLLLVRRHGGFGQNFKISTARNEKSGSEAAAATGTFIVGEDPDPVIRMDVTILRKDRKDA